MTSGQLDALLISHKKKGEWIETPHLATIRYQSAWNWQMPPPPPTDRALDGK